MGLVGKAKRGGRPGGDGAKGQTHTLSKGGHCCSAPVDHCSVDMQPCVSNFPRKAGNPDFFLVCKWGRGYLLIFQCWQLIQKFEKQPAGQRKHIHSLSWLTGCQLLASSLKEMGRNRHM